MSGRRGLAGLALGLALSAAAARPAAAQQEPVAAATVAADTALWRRSLWVAGEAGYGEHRADVGLGLERASGTTLGIAAQAVVTPWLELGLRGSTGRLGPRTPLATERTLQDVELGAAILPLPWLALQLGGAARTWGSSLGDQRWVSLRTGAEARLDFVGGALRGVIGASLLPQVSVTGLPEAPNVAFATVTGLRVRGRRIEGAMLYTMERFDFPSAQGRRRLEQVSTLRLQGGLRLSR